MGYDLRVGNKVASKGSCFDELFAGRFQVWSIGIFLNVFSIL